MGMTDSEIACLFREEADEVLFEDMRFDSRLKEAVRSAISKGTAIGTIMGATVVRRAGPSRRLLRMAAVTALAAALAVALWPHVAGEMGFGYYPPGVPLAPMARGTEGSGVATSDQQQNGPAPKPFEHPFRVIADPYPVCLGQAVGFSSDPGWPGRHVWLYGVPSEDQRTLLWERLLPRDAVLIGNAPIDAEGQWSFGWDVPGRLTHGEKVVSVGEGLDEGRQSYIYIVAVTDSGYLAAQGLELGPRRTLTVQPLTITAGTHMTVSGSGYASGTRLRLDILHERPGGGTDLQVVIGWATVGEDGSFTFTYAVPTELNWPYAEGEGSVVDHKLTVGDPGTYTLQVLESRAGQSPGPLLRKLLDVKSTP